MAALRAQGITVSGSAVGQSGFAVPGALLYTHHSSDLAYQGRPLRLGVACIPLLKVSHNVMADLLCRHLGWKLGAGDSYAAGTTEVLGWLGHVAGLRTNGLVMNDGSGLSRGNRFSARQCVALTRYMRGAYPAWDGGLPIGCVDGTLRRRFCGTDGAKEVHAKTGSLRTAISLSGYVNNPFDDQRYRFSFLANRTNIDQSATRQAMDNCVALFSGPFRIVQPQVSWTGSSGRLHLGGEPGPRLPGAVQAHLDRSGLANAGFGDYGHEHDGLGQRSRLWRCVAALLSHLSGALSYCWACGGRALASCRSPPHLVSCCPGGTLKALWWRSQVGRVSYCGCGIFTGISVPLTLACLVSTL